MDEQGALGQTQTSKGGIQRVEARTGYLGGIQETLSDLPVIKLGKLNPTCNCIWPAISTKMRRAAISNKRHTEQNVGPLLSKTCDIHQTEKMLKP